MKKLDPFKYAAEARERNKDSVCCGCSAKREKDAAEKLAQVQRIIAARTPPQEAKVIRIERRRGR